MCGPSGAWARWAGSVGSSRHNKTTGREGSNTYHPTGSIPDDPPLPHGTRVEVGLGQLDIRPTAISMTLFYHAVAKSAEDYNSPDLPSVRTGDVRLAVNIPKGLRVITNKIEMGGVRPRCIIVRVLALEDDLPKQRS